MEQNNIAQHRNTLLTTITPSQVEDIVWEELNSNPELFRLGAEYMLQRQKSRESSKNLAIINYPLVELFFEQELSKYVKDWSLVDEYVERLKNTKYIYGSDVFDILRYCFPFDYKDERKEDLPIHLIVDQQLAWQWFFDKKHIVLLDQYVLELRGQKRKIEELFHGKVIDEFEEIVKILNLKKIEFSGLSTVKQLENNLSLFLGSILGFSQKGMDKLSTIIENQLLIDHDSIVFDKEYPEQLTQRFAWNHPSQDTLTFYIDRRKDILQAMQAGDLKLSEDEKAKRNVERFNTLYTDCQVVDRIININQSLQSPIEIAGKNTRYLFLFVSSTEGFEEHFPNHKLFLKKRPEDTFGRKTNVLRNVKQLYLQLLANSSPSDSTNPFEKFNTYLIYLNVVRARELYHAHRKEFTNSDQFRELTEQLRRSYANLQILEHYINFYDSVSKSIDEFKRKISYSNLSSIFDDINKIVGDYDKIRLEINNSNSILRKLFISYTFQERIEYAIPQLRKDGIVVNYAPSDYVVGIDHHLPTVLQVRNPKYQQILEKVIAAILRPIYGKEFRHEFADFLTDIIADSVLNQKENIERIDLLKIGNSFDDNIVKYLLFLILPYPMGGGVRRSSPETDLLWVITSDIRQLRDDLIPSSTGSQKSSFLKTLQNLRYIKAWALRRLGNFEESLRILNIALDTDKDDLSGQDPRFYHGIALAQYCIFRDIREKTGTREVELITKAMKAADISFFEYEKSGILNKSSYPTTNADVKAFVALVNSLVNLKVLLFSYQYRSEGKLQIDYELVTDSRKLIDRYLKNCLKEINSEFIDYPEYQHTEAFLLRYEAQIAFDRLDNSLAKIKLDIAYNLLDQYRKLARIRDAGNSKKLKQSESFYLDLMNDINDLLSKINKPS